MTDWKWSEQANRYIDADTGRFISHSYVLGLIEQSLNQSIRVTDTLASYVSAGKINVQDWVGLMRSEIRDEYIRQYLAGIGGRSQMTPARWGEIGGLLKSQFRYLTAFSLDLSNLSEAQIKMRAAMYVNSAGQAYERAHAQVAKNWGADTVLWSVNRALENCDDCLDRQSQGPKPIGPHGGFPTIDGESWPRDFSTQCRMNCGCTLIFSDSKTGQTFEGE